MPSCGATRHMKTVAAKKMASDNVFRVGASFRTFVEMQNALRLFEQQTHSQFYMRDARTLNAAKKTTPNVPTVTATTSIVPDLPSIKLPSSYEETRQAKRMRKDCGRITKEEAADGMRGIHQSGAKQEGGKNVVMVCVPQPRHCCPCWQ